jgi:hypothetical protein
MDDESDEVNRATERGGCERTSVLAGYAVRIHCSRRLQWRMNGGCDDPSN